MHWKMRAQASLRLCSRLRPARRGGHLLRRHHSQQPLVMCITGTWLVR